MIINYNAKYDGQIKDLLVDLQNYLVVYCKRINIEVFGPNKKGLNFYEKNDYIIRNIIVSKKI